MSMSNGPQPGRPVRGSESGRPIMAAFDLLGRRWMLRLIGELGTVGPHGFLDLQRAIAGISSSVLTTRLRELVAAGIAVRDVDGRYLLTDLGSKLLLALASLWTWSDEWAQATGATANEPLPSELIEALQHHI